jgi:hypothetical protein
VLWVLLALLVVVLSMTGESYENLMYPGQPARFFDTDSRGNPLRWAQPTAE